VRTRNVSFRCERSSTRSKEPSRGSRLIGRLFCCTSKQVHNGASARLSRWSRSGNLQSGKLGTLSVEEDGWIFYVNSVKTRRVPRTRFRASRTPGRQRSSRKRVGSRRRSLVKRTPVPPHGGLVNWISTNRKLIGGNCTRGFSGNAVSFGKRERFETRMHRARASSLLLRGRKIPGGGSGRRGAALISGDVRESARVGGSLVAERTQALRE